MPTTRSARAPDFYYHVTVDKLRKRAPRRCIFVLTIGELIEAREKRFEFVYVYLLTLNFSSSVCFSRERRISGFGLIKGWRLTFRGRFLRLIIWGDANFANSNWCRFARSYVNFDNICVYVEYSRCRERTRNGKFSTVLVFLVCFWEIHGFECVRDVTRCLPRLFLPVIRRVSTEYFV